MQTFYFCEEQQWDLKSVDHFGKCECFQNINYSSLQTGRAAYNCLLFLLYSLQHTGHLLSWSDLFSSILLFYSNYELDTSLSFFGIVYC